MLKFLLFTYCPFQVSPELSKSKLNPSLSKMGLGERPRSLAKDGLHRLPPTLLAAVAGLHALVEFPVIMNPISDPWIRPWKILQLQDSTFWISYNLNIIPYHNYNCHNFLHIVALAAYLLCSDFKVKACKLHGSDYETVKKLALHQQ